MLVSTLDSVRFFSLLNYVLNFNFFAVIFFAKHNFYSTSLKRDVHTINFTFNDFSPIYISRFFPFKFEQPNNTPKNESAND